MNEYRLNERKITWCENWLKKTFEKYPRIERYLLFNLANKAGLYTPNTYGSEFSIALTNLNVNFENVCDSNNELLYCVCYL